MERSRSTRLSSPRSQIAHLKLPMRSSSSLALCRLQQSVLADFSPSFPSSLSARGFIPFLQERDGLGKLISTPGRAEITAKVERGKAGVKPKLTELKLRLRKKTLALVPPLGTYSILNQWGKKSFRTPRKCLTERASMPVSATPSLPKQVKSDFEYSLPRLMLQPKPRHRQFRADYSDLKAKNSFGSLELQGDPVEIKTNLAFKPQIALKEQVMSNFREMTRSIYSRWHGGA